MVKFEHVVKESGKLIVFEGPDGVGKSSVIKKCSAYLKGIGVPIEVISFPGSEPGTLGADVYRLHHLYYPYNDLPRIDPASLQLLHVAAHIDAISRKILPTLRNGIHVILDRYWWSTWVYGAASGIQTTLLDSIVNLEMQNWADILPATVILLQAERPWRNNESAERFQELHDLYMRLAKREEGKYAIRIINNSQGKEQTLSETLEALLVLLKASPSTVQMNVKHKHLTLPSARVEKAPSHLGPTVIKSISPAVPSDTFDSYWRFAAERQSIFFLRMEVASPPWTTDPILATYKFTNAYRAEDRVSQYLIRHVIYEGDAAPEEVFFRIMLFKIFNRIGTWQLLQEALGEIVISTFSVDRYIAVLGEAQNKGTAIFSGAYMMPSGTRTFGDRIKHRNWLHLLELMLEDEVPQRIVEMPSMREAFYLLRSYPMLGDFLAYQYITDLNYSELTYFSEMEFTVPGPGARSGIRKCFTSLGGLNEADIIQMVSERQEEHFSRLGLTFRSLWGRPLQLIDCQNLFCEVDKYARVAHPNVQGIGDRIRIKQAFRPSEEPISYWFPPKWGVNERMTGD
jgi:thymidylate kinase